MIIVIGFTIIVLAGYNMIYPDKNLTKLAKELKNYDERITVFQSANKKTIDIECNFDTEEEAVEKSNEIGKIINKHIDYLSIYNNINMIVYTKNGMKTNFTVNVETKRQIKIVKKTGYWRAQRFIIPNKKKLKKCKQNKMK